EKFYQNLIQIKKKNKALWNGISGGKLLRINSSDDENIFAFIREKNGNKIFAIFNFSGENQNITFKGDKFIGEFIDAFSGEEIKFSANEKLELKPWGYFVFEGK
ncbi:MAG: alpha-glucosidase C-terminal domain-containing protein, partial [Candidatus Cloacimonadota bacterium]|nr:alpha-glucosidase C-terminal domain-containing protein [Candidatus Cloacimonadota bacterium]